MANRSETAIRMPRSYSIAPQKRAIAAAGALTTRGAFRYRNFMLPERESGSECSDRSGGSVEIPDRISVFPLPTVVLFPRTYLPLHIFEPRYRQMVVDAVAHHQCIGMALLKDGWEAQYEGNPPVYAVGCVGRLTSVEPLPDGRFNILLQGLARFVIEEEFADRPYREARIVLQPMPTAAAMPEPLKRELLELVQTYASVRDERHAGRELLGAVVHDEILINGLATYLDWTPVEKQFLLEADTLEQRARRLADLLRFAIEDPRNRRGWN